MRWIITFIAESWALIAPFWRSEERWRARLLLAVVILLNLALVGMTVLLTYWQRAFYNTLESKDWDGFIALLFTWHRTEAEGLLPGFVLVAVLYILIAVYQLYLRQALQMRWRRWLTEVYLSQWLADRAYYRMALTDPGMDNPDQRIADDARLFVEDTLSLGIGLLNSIVTLGSFIFVLWSLSRTVTVLGVEIPGYMVWVALIYALLGTWLAHLIGRPLIALNFSLQRLEADFRYALVRLRENTEGVALYGGEADEKRGLTQRFTKLMVNWWDIMRATKRLTFFTAGYGQVASIFPIVVAAPAYFAGRLPLGGLIQTSSAFGQVQGSLSWFVDNYGKLTEWRATVQRLSGFTKAVATARASATGPVAQPGEAGRLTLHDMTLSLPDGRVLMADAALQVAAGDAVLINGPSGSGKSTLFRAMAGIWPFGTGKIALPKDARILFLPQRPYLPLGSLKRAICYPENEAEFSNAAVLTALGEAGLGHLAPRLAESDSWTQRLSGGEQQRLSFARAFLLRPDWLFLDEATASLDPEAEDDLHARLKSLLPKVTIVSIAHRPAVAEFHDRVLRVEDGLLVEMPRG
ncbi:MAG: ABC transporter ATP-binding protein/permease [Alphaproteobacteria bacterium]|nr:ABC transporter ATP-binding protein/permease [Alphaproteobacteria bacterium]